MSAAHTPWAVKEDPLYPSEFYVMDNDGHTVASGIMRKDRADILAAAPQLVEALTVARRFIVCAFPDLRDDSVAGMELARINAALASAGVAP